MLCCDGRLNDAASSISEERRAGKIREAAERFGRTESKDNKWMAEVEAQLAALKAANGGAGEDECRLASDEAHKRGIQATAERYGRTESKDNKWMAEVEAQLAALQAAQGTVAWDASRTASEIARQERIKKAAERLGRTGSKDEKWMAEINAQVAVLQAKMALEASACEFRATSSSSGNGSTSGSIKRATGNGIHDEYRRKKEQNEQDMLALSQWARENRAPSNYTDYRGRLSSRGSSHDELHEDTHSSSSVDGAASCDYEGSDCSSDFGMSDDGARTPDSLLDDDFCRSASSLERSDAVPPFKPPHLPDLEHTIFTMEKRFRGREILAQAIRLKRTRAVRVGQF